MTPVYAIDPGPAQSAFLRLDDSGPTHFGIRDNDSVLRNLRTTTQPPGSIVVVIEWIESFGMAVGREVFETVHWSGRFTEAAQPLEVVQLPRRQVKLHLCGSPRANDSNIRQALIDRYGGQQAIGRKASPGPLYGISKDVWSALALAVTYSDQQKGKT